jgi:hypothetical protein
MDWLLPESAATITSPKDVGSMASTTYGIVLLVLVLIGLSGHDAFLGFSYLACLFVKGVKPGDLHVEACLEQPKKRRREQQQQHDREETRDDHTTTKLRTKAPSRRNKDDSVDDEIAALLR